MAYDGNGNFVRVYNWTQDASAKVKIRSDRHDTNDDDLAAGLTNAMTKDGQSQPTRDIPMNGKKLVNLGDPVVDSDAANKKYVDALKSFKTGLEISGADTNGQLKFTSATGANGLAFTGADLSWLAKLADGTATPPKLNRMVLNDKPDGTGTDVVTVNDDGTLVALKHVAAGPTAEVQIKPTTGNGVVSWFAVDGTTGRMSLYTSSGAQASGFLTVGAQNFEFQNGGAFKAPGNLGAGGASLATDGNIFGGVWANWGPTDAYSAISSRIESRSIAWANDRVANLQYRKVSEGSTTQRGLVRCPGGAVMTGLQIGTGQGEFQIMIWMYLQVYDPVRGWVGFSG